MSQLSAMNAGRPMGPTSQYMGPQSQASGPQGPWLPGVPNNQYQSPGFAGFVTGANGQLTVPGTGPQQQQSMGAPQQTQQPQQPMMGRNQMPPMSVLAQNSQQSSPGMMPPAQGGASPGALGGNPPPSQQPQGSMGMGQPPQSSMNALAANSTQQGDMGARQQAAAGGSSAGMNLPGAAGQPGPQQPGQSTDPHFNQAYANNYNAANGTNFTNSSQFQGLNTGPQQNPYISGATGQSQVGPQTGGMAMVQNQIGQPGGQPAQGIGMFGNMAGPGQNGAAINSAPMQALAANSQQPGMGQRGGMNPQSLMQLHQQLSGRTGAIPGAIPGAQATQTGRPTQQFRI